MELNETLNRQALLKKIEQTRRELMATSERLTTDRLTEMLHDLEYKLHNFEAGSCPPPEEELGGGDICSLEQEPSTEDDQPLK